MFRVNIIVRLGVILLDVLKIRRLLKSLHIPVQVLEVIVQEWVVVSDGAKIALEVLHVDGVEPDQRRVGADIDFCQLGAEDVGPAALGEELLELVEGAEDGDDVLVVGRLIRREAGFVDSRVEVALHPVGDGVDLGAQMLRVEIRDGDLVWEEGIESRLKITEEFGALVVDDGVRLLVPENWNGIAAFVFFVCSEVDFVEMLTAEEVVDG